MRRFQQEAKERAQLKLQRNLDPKNKYERERPILGVRRMGLFFCVCGVSD